MWILIGLEKGRKRKGKKKKKIDDLQCELGRTMGSPNTDREVEDEGDFCRQDAWPKLRAIDEGFTKVGVRSAYGGGDCVQTIDVVVGPECCTFRPTMDSVFYT